MRIKDISLKRKIIVLNLVLASLLVSTVAISYVSTEKTSDAYCLVKNKAVPDILSLFKIHSSFKRLFMEVQGFVGSGDIGEIDEFEEACEGLDCWITNYADEGTDPSLSQAIFVSDIQNHKRVLVEHFDEIRRLHEKKRGLFDTIHESMLFKREAYRNRDKHSEIEKEKFENEILESMELLCLNSVELFACALGSEFDDEEQELQDDGDEVRVASERAKDDEENENVFQRQARLSEYLDRMVFAYSIKFQTECPYSRQVAQVNTISEETTNWCRRMGTIIEDIEDVEERVLVSIQGAIESHEKNLEFSSHHVHSVIAKSRLVLVALLLSFVVISPLTNIGIFRNVFRSIRKLLELTHKISNGDLGCKVSIQSNDELGRLGESFNDMVAGLRDSKEQVDRQAGELICKNRQLQEAVHRSDLMAEEALEANRAKSMFLASMSHEIRTPMNSILGFSEILLESGLSEEETDYIGHIYRNAENLLEIINDILDFSKIEAGKIEIEKVPVELGMILADLESLFLPRAIDKKIQFKVLHCSDFPLSVIIDPVRMRQCLINLLNNAIKFTHEGHVYLNISMENINDEPMLRFDVEDTGIGIESEKLEMVFQSFSQADNSTTRRYGGTGLGLAITRQLVELMGGRVSVKSAVGKGSTFTILLSPGHIAESAPKADPYNVIEEIINPAGLVEEVALSGKILVVEDNESNRRLISLYLGKSGLEIDFAEDGKIAFEKAGKNHYDLIFMDINLPIMNGYEVTRRLRKMGVETPITALTANALTGDEQKCLDAGCDQYLPKPIKRQDIHRVVKEYIGLKEVEKQQGKR